MSSSPQRGCEADAGRSGRSVEEIFDELVAKTGYLPEAAWTEGVVRLHEHSLQTGLVVMPEHWGTPVYRPAALPDSVWSGTFEAGVRYDVETQLRFFAEVCHFRDELAALDITPPPGGDLECRRFYWRNTEFSHGDAALYYSLIRHLAPERLVEVGGGYSTLLALEGLRRNGRGSVTCVEPLPRPFLERDLPGLCLDRRPVQELPISFFTNLTAGDILFVDGSHICKTGSDVNHLLLRILPLLPAGVWIHVHDIFLPFEYPKDWVKQRLYWNEQYVLAALLANSPKLEPVLAHYFLLRQAGQRLADYLPAIAGVQPGGTSFWIRTR
jgi:methyltransferase family protein